MVDGSVKEVSVTPVVAALTTVAQAIGEKVLPHSQVATWHTQTGFELAVFSYSQDFSHLWGLQDGDGGLLGITKNLVHVNNELTILIVWDGMPESSGTVEVDRYVTPYDWSMALSTALYRQNSEVNSRPKLRILILDITSHQVEKGFLQRSFSTFHNIFPWIQDYRPVAEVDDGYIDDDLFTEFSEIEYALARQIIPSKLRDISRLIRDLVSSDYVLTTLSEYDDVVQRERNLETFIQAWQKEFLKSGTRHSIANIVGPFVMANGFAEPLRSTIRKCISEHSESRLALIEVLRVLQILEETQGAGLVVDKPISASKPFQHRKLRVLLVDDQCENGLQHIVGSVLFGENYFPVQKNNSKFSYGNVTLKSEFSADSILTVLKAYGKIQDWDFPRMLEIEFDILLLDLRLWLDAETDKRQLFFGSLVDTCDQLDVDILVQRDSHFSTALEAGRTIKEQGEGNEITALALLPLLLSYFDPSFPIVLFSSTHQRQLVEMLAHRKNIISDFSKPVDGGYGEKGVAYTAIKDLRQSIERAVRLYETRVVWRQLAKIKPENIEMPIIKKLKPKDSPIAKSRISHEDIIKKLGKIYETYILNQQFYDFLSIPWEFLEATLSPGFTDSAVNYSFDVFSSRLAFSMKQCRHKKAHGSFLVNEFAIEANWTPSIQTCVVLEFLFLINLLSPVDSSQPSEISDELQMTSRKFEEKLRTKYPELQKVKYILQSNGTLKVLNGGEYVFLALAEGVRKSGESLSTETLKIFEGVKVELFS